MKILILGDTHAQDDIFLRILSAEKDIDAMLHAGDFEGSEFIYSELTDCPFYYIAGNNDFFTDAPYERIVELDSSRIFMTHGHRYDLHSGYTTLHREAVRRGASIAVYGHTHEPVAEYYKKEKPSSPFSVTPMSPSRSITRAFSCSTRAAPPGPARRTAGRPISC